MNVAYFDCFSGICGDMILGALIDLGLDYNYLKNELKKINISGYEIVIKKIEKNQIACTDVNILVKEKQQHRSLREINRLIDNSDLDMEVKDISKKVFLKIAEVESKIHNVEVSKVHFHEVGAVDSIMDIIGTVVGLKKLGIERVFCSNLPLGKGFVNCFHGVIPVPVPATVELLKNVPVYQTDIDHEMVTPTGAAVITTIADAFGKMPLMKIKKVGYGAGKIESKSPGILRVLIGELEKQN
ncbi:MAG: nickel pincer cofactor biosynthesis protein LarC [Thermoplasmatales archaeon]|nr:MAG: nickel pincer cofactor biosynthesis protein LarC [Thermoplasmatales archaeon]